jgi:hypothetical protein
MHHRVLKSRKPKWACSLDVVHGGEGRRRDNRGYEDGRQMKLGKDHASAHNLVLATLNPGVL